MNFGRIIYMSFLLLALAASAGFYFIRSTPPTALEQVPVLSVAAPMAMEWLDIPPRKTISGQYLAGHFAQSRYDWQEANNHLSFILEHDPDDEELIKRSMILAIGTGDLELAATRATRLLDFEGDNSLALMTLAVKALAEDHDGLALQYLEQMHAGDITDYVRPLLQGWAQAADDTPDLSGLDSSLIHNFHGALITLYQNDKDKALGYLKAFLSAPTLNGMELERAADVLALAGDSEEALAIYRQLIAKSYSPDVTEELEGKITLLENNPEDLAPFHSFLKIETPKQGAALAMYDMAQLLFQEQSENSARLFAHMALALNPDMVQTRFLLANMAAHVDRLPEAIAYLQAIPADHPDYLKAQQAAADFLSETGQTAQAEALLYKLFDEYDDVDSLIRIGDLHRRAEDFSEALKIYNRAARQIGDPIPEQYWYLLYARGMAYERSKSWDKAEKDLKAALGYRPNHPYLLNYLGYGWADQGLNLEESLKLIKRAVELRPTDGYIIDSLGWVYYMMDRFEEAIPYLEQAVSLMPADATMNDHLGDAYWQAGRRLEARFQWERALNNIDDDPGTAEGSDVPDLAANLKLKLRYGLNIPEEIRNALGETAHDK